MRSITDSDAAAVLSYGHDAKLARDASQGVSLSVNAVPRLPAPDAAHVNGGAAIGRLHALAGRRADQYTVALSKHRCC
jgi:hypothetical protein